VIYRLARATQPPPNRVPIHVPFYVPWQGLSRPVWADARCLARAQHCDLSTARC